MSIHELESIKGIGPHYRHLLLKAGVHTLEDLAQSTPEQLGELLAVESWRKPNYASWIKQARALLASGKSESRMAEAPAPPAAGKLAAAMPEIYDPTAENHVDVRVGAVDATFGREDDVLAAMPAPDLNRTTAHIEPEVGEVGTIFPALESEAPGPQIEEAAEAAAGEAGETAETAIVMPEEAAREALEPPAAGVEPAAEAEGLPERTSAAAGPLIEEAAEAAAAEAEEAVKTAPPPAPQPPPPPPLIPPRVGEMEQSFAETPAPEPAPPAAAPSPPEPREAPPSPPTPPPPAGQDKQRKGCLRQIGMVLVAALAGAALGLLTLFLINGTLDFGRHEAVVSLQNDVDVIDQRLQEQDKALSELGSAVKASEQKMDALSAQVEAAQTQISAFDDHLNILADDLNAMRDDLVTLAEQQSSIEKHLAEVDQAIAQLRNTAERFDILAVGLKELADAIQPPAPEAPANMATPAPAPTPTAPITETIPFSDSQVNTQAAVPEAVSGSLALQNFPPRQSIPTPTPGQSMIIGLVWDDLNGNGMPEPTEIPLPGVRISLKDVKGETVAEAETGDDGRYQFLDLTPGAYVLIENDPPGTSSVTPNTVTVATVANGIVEINFADSHLR